MILNFLKDLVAYPSVTPDDEGSLNYLEKFIQDLGGVNEQIVRNGTKNLLANVGQGKKTFAFAGHVDIVPPGEHKAWINQNPFQLYVAGNQVVGRGVADMKGSIAAFMVACAKFIKSVAIDKYRILFLITADEEGSAIDGTAAIVDYIKQKSINIDYCLVGEPSCVTRLGDTIKVGRRGSLTGHLTVRGRQGHIAYPHLGVNPIHKALPALNELAEIKWDEGNEYFPPTGLQFANLNSGLGVTNVIPGILTANFNLRYNNLHEAGELQTRIESVLDRYNLDYSIKWNHSAQPFLTKVGKFTQISQEATYEATGIVPELKTDGGTSDGRFLIEVCDEIIELGLRNNSIHQINECTTISDLEQLSDIYYKILDKVFNGAKS